MAPPLRETRQDDALGRDSAVDLSLDQGAQLSSGGLDARTVLLAPEIGAFNVIPGRHSHAAVDCHCALWRMRQHHTHTQGVDYLQLRDQRCKVMAVGTEPVQPDDAGRGVAGWIDFNGIEAVAVHRA